jgi:hypothetical protein
MTPAAIDDEPRSISVAAARIPVSRFVIDAGYPPRPLPNFPHVDNSAVRDRSVPRRAADRDPAVKVIVLRGAGRAFSGGYDFGGGFAHWGEPMNTDGRWDPGKDFAMVAPARQDPHRSSWRSGGRPNR